MMPQLSSREIEMLSTYLDGHLSAREQAALQAQLAQRADLRQGLEELRQTRALLQHAPRRKVPRNFMLKPEMVPARRRPMSRPVLSLGLASVLATIFLLLSVVIEFVPLPSFGAGAPMAPVMPLVQDAGTERNLASTAPQPTKAAEAGKSMGTSVPTAAPATLPTHLTGAPLATPTAPEQMRSTGDIPPAATLPAPQPTKAPDPTQVMQVAPTRPPAAIQPAPSATPADAEYKMAAQPTAERQTPGGVDTAPIQARKTLTWLQTLLVVLAAVTALAALYLRRKH
jgi:hypothetical protein